MQVEVRVYTNAEKEGCVLEVTFAGWEAYRPAKVSPRAYATGVKLVASNVNDQFKRSLKFSLNTLFGNVLDVEFGEMISLTKALTEAYIGYRDSRIRRKLSHNSVEFVRGQSNPELLEIGLASLPKDHEDRVAHIRGILQRHDRNLRDAEFERSFGGVPLLPGLRVQVLRLLEG